MPQTPEKPELSAEDLDVVVGGSGPSSSTGGGSEINSKPVGSAEHIHKVHEHSDKAAEHGGKEQSKPEPPPIPQPTPKP